jgi:hypothetical protein
MLMLHLFMTQLRQFYKYILDLYWPSNVHFGANNFSLEFTSITEPIIKAAMHT